MKCLGRVDSPSDSHTRCEVFYETGNLILTSERVSVKVGVRSECIKLGRMECHTPTTLAKERPFPLFRTLIRYNPKRVARFQVRWFGREFGGPKILYSQ